MESGEGGGDNRGEQGGEKRDIRRPMNAFLIFCKRHRSMVREKHPDRDNRSVTRILGDLWANLPDEEKMVYTNLAKQYKDAFMKAHPDYKWHSSEKVSQPAKMATRPTNARPPRSLSTSDYPTEGGIMPGQLADPDKMGGLNLLLMAGQHSFPVRDKPATLSTPAEMKAAAREVSGANAALLQLAEMCSSELRSTQADDTALRSAPPKKRARHWSYSEFGHSSSADLVHRTAAQSIWSLPPLQTSSVPSKPSQPHAASLAVATFTTTTSSQSENSGQKQDRESKQQSVGSNTSSTVPANGGAPFAFTPHSEPLSQKEQEQQHFPPVMGTEAQKASGRDGSLQTTAAMNYEVGMPPKKKFTKLQESCKTEPPTTPSPNSTPGSCLSDQNDNAIFTCGKLVVDHIIDRLFSASFMPDQSTAAQSLSAVDIEKARKILTEDITEREKCLTQQTADISAGRSASRDMGRLLSEVVQKPQNLVEKVIEEAYSSIDLKRQLGAASQGQQNSNLSATAMPAAQKETITSHIKQEPVDAEVKPAVPAQEEQSGAQPSFRHFAFEMKGTHARNSTDEKPSTLTSAENTVYQKEESRESAQDEDENFMQPVRKSQRRNRGQRYQELINEGIIQPSKERLAARRHEQTVTYPQSFPDGDECSMEEEGDKPRHIIKRSISESESVSGDEKRYRTADFDLEAEIATLPPCSLEQVTRRRLSRKRSDSESSRKQGCPSPTAEDGSSASKPQQQTSAPPKPEPLTGSQKRKARKHSISRLVASTEAQSGGGLKSPGVVTTITLVRDATADEITATTPNPTPSSSRQDSKQASSSFSFSSTFSSSSSSSVTSSATSISKTTTAVSAQPSTTMSATLPSVTMTTTCISVAMTTTGNGAALGKILASVPATSANQNFVSQAGQILMASAVTSASRSLPSAVDQNVTGAGKSVSKVSAVGSEKKLLWPETMPPVMGAAQKIQLLANEQRKSEAKNSGKNSASSRTGNGNSGQRPEAAFGASWAASQDAPKVAPVTTEFTNLKELDDNTWIPCYIPKGKPDAGSSLYGKSSEGSPAGSANNGKNQGSKGEGKKTAAKQHDGSSAAKDWQKQATSGLENGGKGGNSLSGGRVSGPAGESKVSEKGKSAKQSASKRTVEGKKMVSGQKHEVVTCAVNTAATPRVAHFLAAQVGAPQTGAQKLLGDKPAVLSIAVRDNPLPSTVAPRSTDIKSQAVTNSGSKSVSAIAVALPQSTSVVLGVASLSLPTTARPQPVILSPAINTQPLLASVNNSTNSVTSSAAGNTAKVSGESKTEVFVSAVNFDKSDSRDKDVNNPPVTFSQAPPSEISVSLQAAPKTVPQPAEALSLNQPAMDKQTADKTEATATTVTSVISSVPSSSYDNASFNLSALAAVSTAALVSCVETTVSVTTTVSAPSLNLEMMRDESGAIETTVGGQMLCQSALPGSPTVGVVHS